MRRLILAGWVLAGAVLGQNVKFDVASIRPAEQGIRRSFSGGPGTADPTRYTAISAALSDILVDAYGVGIDQISAPAWMDTARFNINANIPKGATREQFREMLQNLLEERFRLTAHHEKKNFMVYEMTIAKSGLKMKPSAEDPNAAPPEYGLDGIIVLRRSSKDGLVTVDMPQMTLPDVVRALKRLGVRVVDKTGLTGRYNFDLIYEPPGSRSLNEIQANPAPPDFLSAIEKQLGLHLQKVSAPLDFVVVDHADKVPTQN
jgi:uncharacterized protein (TIGR03435 family)